MAPSSGWASEDVTYVKGALTEANRLVAKHPEQIAVVVRIGKATTVQPGVIAYWLRKDFDDAGCTTHFVFERGSAEGSAVGFVTRNHAWGPFSLAASRKNVAESCKQHLFEVQRGIN